MGSQDQTVEETQSETKDLDGVKVVLGDKSLLAPEDGAKQTMDYSVLGISQEEYAQALSEDRLRVVFLVGDPQVGKSTLASHLLGKDVSAFDDGTKRCRPHPELFILRHEDKIILLVDTPGLNPKTTEGQERIQEIISCELSKFESISTVLVCVDAKNPFVTASLVSILQQMKKPFGDDFDKLVVLHMTQHTMVNANGFPDDYIHGAVYKERILAENTYGELGKWYKLDDHQGPTFSNANPEFVPFDKVNSPPEIVQAMKNSHQKALQFRAELLEKLASATMYPILVKKERDICSKLAEEIEALNIAQEKRHLEDSVTNDNLAQIIKEADQGGRLAFLKDDEPPCTSSHHLRATVVLRGWGEKGNFHGYGSGNRYDNIDIRAIEGAKLKLPDKCSKPWKEAIRSTIDTSDCYIDLYEVSTIKSHKMLSWENRRLTINVKPKTPFSDQAKQAAEMVLNQVVQERARYNEPTKQPVSVPNAHQTTSHPVVLETKTSRNLKPGEGQSGKPTSQLGTAIFVGARNLFAYAKKATDDYSEYALKGPQYREALAQGNLRIVFLVGQSQVGKSTLTCHLLGKDVAAIGDGAKRCTVRPQHFVLRHEGRIILLVDTPGLNDKDAKDEDHMENICRKLSIFDSVSTVLLCVNAKSANISRSMVQVLKHLRKAFGEDLEKMMMLHMTKHTMVNGDELSDDDPGGEICRDQVVGKTMHETLASKYLFDAQQGYTFSNADPDLVAFDEVSSSPEKVQAMVPAQQKALRFRAELIEKLASATMYPTLAKKERDIADEILRKEGETKRSAMERRIWEESITKNKFAQIMKEVNEDGRLSFLKEHDERLMYVLYSNERMCGFERRVKKVDAVLSFGTHYWRDNIDFRTAEGVKLELLDKDVDEPRLYLHWSDTIRNPIDFKKYYIDSYDFTTTTDTMGFIWWDHRRLIINVKPLTSVDDQENEGIPTDAQQDSPVESVETEYDRFKTSGDPLVEKAMEIVQKALLSVENDSNIAEDAKEEAMKKKLEILLKEYEDKDLERAVMAVLRLDPSEDKNTKETIQSASSESMETTET